MRVEPMLCCAEVHMDDVLVEDVFGEDVECQG